MYLITNCCDVLNLSFLVLLCFALLSVSVGLTGGGAGSLHTVYASGPAPYALLRHAVEGKFLKAVSGLDIKSVD